jgi:ABC-2 type transport system ATP-binding protein
MATPTKPHTEPAVGISVRNLTKAYSKRIAVEDVSFDLTTGVTALLGPNGAGKTTIIRCAVGLQSWNSGTISVGGVDALSDPRGARRRIGYMPERVAFPPEMRVRAFLEHAARMKRVPRNERREAVDTAITRMDLGAVAHRIVANLSKGFRQRVGLAQATLGDPPVLILDEPLSGVDPVHVWEFRDVLWEYGREHTVLLSTHILPEARVLCDRVIVIAGHRVAFDGSLVEAELDSSVTRRWRIGVSGGRAQEVTGLVDDLGGSVLHQSESGLAVNLVIDAPKSDIIDAFVRRALEHGWRVAHFEPMTDMIEAAFAKAGVIEPLERSSDGATSTPSDEAEAAVAQNATIGGDE